MRQTAGRACRWVACALAACTLAACGAEPGRKPTPPPLEVAGRQVPGGDAARGRELLDRYQCGSCHVVPDAVGSGQPWAPPLTAWGGRSTLAGVLPNDAATLVRWLQDPPALVPGTRIPRLGVSEADARDLAAALMAMH
jgi:cytochrome c1